VSPRDIPVIAFSVGEGELSVMDKGASVGHLAAWNYFMSLDTAENTAFIRGWQRHSGGKRPLTSDPIEAQYLAFSMWTAAVTAAGSTDTDQVRQEMIGRSVRNLSGGTATMLANHHITKPVFIGRVRPDGQYQIIWRSAAEIPGDPWFNPVSAESDKGH
jgi:urea transport system substrate-binding protein